MLSLSLMIILINFLIFTTVFFILPYFYPKFIHSEAWKKRNYSAFNLNTVTLCYFQQIHFQL